MADSPSIELEELMKLVRAHISFTPPNSSKCITDQPQFEDITQYDVKPEDQDLLWTMEAKRLLRVVNDPNTVLVIKDSDILGSANKEGYTRLSHLAEQLLNNLNICVLEDELLKFEHLKDLFMMSEFTKARSILKARFTSETSESIKSAKPIELAPNDNKRAYCALVDYITAHLARFMTKLSTNKYWCIFVLAGLVRYGTKLKFLVTNPQEYAILALESAEDVTYKEEAFRFMGISKKPYAAIRLFQNKGNQSNAKPDENSELQQMFTDDEHMVGRYFAEMALMSDLCVDSLHGIMMCLKGSTLSGFPEDAFEMCSLIYGAGLRPSPTLVYQDRDGEITALSIQRLIRHCQTGYPILYDSAQAISERRRKKGPVAYADDERTQFTLEYEEVRDGSTPITKSTAISLAEMAEVVQVLIPFASMQPGIALKVAVSMEINDAFKSKEPYYQKKSTRSGLSMKAFAAMRTSAYDQALLGSPMGPDARSLSKSLLAQGRLQVLEKKLGNSTQSWEGLIQDDRLHAIHDAELKSAELDASVREWEITENAIRVKCLLYVVGLLIFCGLLVVGGILVGALLGTRLKGVDPFNITTFAWILAGFIIVVAKSMRVNDWPWRDFLLGRVPCRSVSELHSVTGVPPQYIIRYLLSTESSNILYTSGPFNRPFSKRGTDGFSIDVKIELRTLMASGILVLKVATSHGPSLICMDTRTGAVGRSVIRHSGQTDKDEYILSCSQEPEVFDEDQDVPLTRQTMTWSRIIGFYHSAYKKFR
jgi:hypothetical protein